MKKMKKYASMVLTAVMVIALSACAAPPDVQSSSAPTVSFVASEPPVSGGSESRDVTTPGGAALTAFDALKEADIKTFNEYSDNSRRLDEDRDSRAFLGGDMDAEEMEFIKVLFKNTSYQLGEAKIDGDIASIPATVGNTDFSQVIPEFIGTVLSDAFSSHPDVVVDEDEKYTKLLTDSFEKANESGKTFTKNVTLTVNRKDGKWFLHIDDKLVDALSGGMITAAGDIGDGDNLSEVFSKMFE